MTNWSPNNTVPAPLLILGVVELSILFSSVYVAALVRFGDIQAAIDVQGAIAPKAALVAAVTFLSLIAMGLYQFHQRLKFREAAVRVSVGLLAGLSALSILYYVFPGVLIGRYMAGVAVIYAFLLLSIARFIFVRTVDENIFRRRTLVFGAGKRAASIARLRRRADRRGFKLVGKVAAPGDSISDHEALVVTNGRTIKEVAVDTRADEIVIAMDERRGNLPIRALLDARLSGIRVTDLLEFLERESGKIQVDLVNPGWLIFSAGFRISRLRRASQRVLDVVVSSLMFAFSWPIMLAVAVAIKLEDGIRAQVFYRQRRVGKSAKTFWVLKFRSMRTDAESDGRAVWASEDDPRITRVGNVLRRYRMDELPQIFNVLLGTMSLVGPRPERPEFVRELEEKIPYYGERHEVKPGVTGWAQLKYSYGSTDEDALEKLQYDLYYVKNQSFILDIMILLQTVEVVLWGKGAR